MLSAKRKCFGIFLIFCLSIFFYQSRVGAKVYRDIGEFDFEEIKREVKEGNCTKTAEKIESLRKIRGQQSSLYFFEGVCLFKEKKMDLAINSFTKAIEIDPKNAEAFNNRANILFYFKNQVNEAILDYSRAIELKPEEYLFLINRGLAYESIGEFDKALADIKKVIEKNHRMGLAWVLKGNIEYLKKEYKDAIKSFNKALWIDNNLIEAYTGRGLSRIGLNNRVWGCHDLYISLQRGSKQGRENWQVYCSTKK